MKRLRHYLGVKSTLSLILLSVLQCVHADDIEVFDNPGLTGSKPNVLFVFDTSGSMDQPTPSDPSKTKQESLQEAVETLLNTSGMDINAGYLSFGKDKGRGIKFPVADIGSDAHDVDASIPENTTVREVLINMVNAENTSGATPTVDALFEAARYFRGDSVYWGRSGSFNSWDSDATPPHYRQAHWKAANPASYSGTKTGVNRSVPLDTPLGGAITERWCKDYSASGGSNECRNITPAHLDCSTVAATDCEDEEVETCESGWTYPVVNACLTGPARAPTTWLKDSNTKCCTRADPTNVECLSWKWLGFCATPGEETQCRGGNPEYQRCRWLREYSSTDTRTYNSPISQCGTNMIVLLSDGAPSDNDTDWGRLYSNGNAREPVLVRDMIAAGTNAVKADLTDPDLSRNDVLCEDLSGSIFGQSDWQYRYGNCGPELAKFLSTKDQIPGVAGSKVQIHTIGFGFEPDALGSAESVAYLDELAKKGSGEGETGGLLLADSTESLVNALKETVGRGLSGPRSFTGLVTSVNKKRLSHDEAVYLSLFQPDGNRAWDGNVKGYTIGTDGLVGVNSLAATDDNGELVAGAQSYWSAAADGANVNVGGAKSKLIASTRNIYVNTQASVPFGGIDLTTSEMLDANGSLTNTLMGLPFGATTTERRDLIDWARSQRIHDPLHAKPVIVNYGSDGAGKVLFSATNQGYLHAIDANNNDSTGGNELFAFMPYHLTPQLKAMSINAATGNHIYGIDGQISVWVNDANKDGQISGAGEHVYLYFGLRRGGKQYYALDVTDVAQPRLMWRIDAGSTNFGTLGQSWSRMNVVTLNDNGSPRKVIVFTGGYDTVEDTVNVARSANSEGLGVYFVDAVTGTFLASIGPNATDYSVGSANLAYSIPSGVKAIDSDGNGTADRLYFGDMGGQLWRVDIAENADVTAAATYTVTQLADLGVDYSGGSYTATAASHRKFYYPPSVARVERHNSAKVLSVSLGSGYRAHPLNSSIVDHFYSVFDSNAAVGAPASWSLKRTGDLYDATDNNIVEAVDTSAELSSLSSKSGWYIGLNRSGEKVLASSQVIGGDVYFTTYQPRVSICGAEGTNRLYRVELVDATPPMDLDPGESVKGDWNEDGSYNKEDREYTLGQSGIAPEFKRIMLPCSGDGCTQDCVGTECQDGPPRSLKNIFWREER